MNDPRQPPGSFAPRIGLLVVQPTPFCNIDCSYCYLPDRRSTAMVSTETLANLFSQVFASGWVGDCLSVVWHAGEPMVAPVEFYRNAFRMIDRIKPTGLTVEHSFQTNGTLINEAWCTFFIEEHVNVGVSIDGPRRLHDRHRRTRSGRGTFDRVIAGVRLLRHRHVPFHVISVLTTESLAAPRDMFDFYVAEGIEAVCFNVEESEGSHVSTCLSGDDVEAAYYRFLSEFWRLSAAFPGKLTFIREIEQAIQQVIRPKDVPFGNQLVEPFAITSMDWAGNIATFSPELLGLKTRPTTISCLATSITMRSSICRTGRTLPRWQKTSTQALKCAGRAVSTSACVAVASRSTSWRRTERSPAAKPNTAV